MQKASMTVRVTMMGPSRVGKTTLLTAILENARELLASTPVSIDAADPETVSRLRKNENELTADLLAGEFRAGSLTGTKEVSYYNMVIAPEGVEDEGLAMMFLDFPGGLLDPDQRRKRPDDWAEVVSFAKVSTVMLVPVDAVVLMEARTPQQRRALPGVLGLTDVRKAAETWAKSRNDRRDEPATVIFSPVKCESYFTDHGGRGRDRSRELLHRVQEIYGAIVDTVRSEAGHTQLLYAPVDSIGCVELVNPRWTPHPDYGVEPDPEFLVRPPGRRSVLGAKDLLIPIVRQVVSAGRVDAATAEAHARASQELATDLAALGFWDAADRFGFWTELFDRMDGVKQRRKQLEAEATTKATAALERLATYDRVLEGISNRSFGPRVHSL